MPNRVQQAEAMFRKKFAQLGQLIAAMGEKAAWEKMLEGYPERQRQHMGAFIKDTTLADGFAKAIPLFKQMGMEMEVIDISNRETDAVLEIQKACPVLALCQEYGFTKPCRAVCELDIEATRRAFPDMKAKILSRQADGDCVCVFKYERDMQA